MLLEKPDWTLWADVAHVRLNEAVALSCNIEPDSLSKYPNSALVREPGFTEYQRRIKLADSHWSAGFLPVVRHDVNRHACNIDLIAFRAWAERLQRPFTFPPEFPTLPTTPQQTVSSRWPWGDYETILLRKLAEAASKFWANYDPTDPSTAARNDDVSAWLRSEGVSRRVAEVIAQVLRADGLRTGPR